MPIELAGIELPRIHRLSTVERADFASHRVPGLNGNLVQDLGRESVAMRIEGIFYGLDAAEKLEQLRAAYKSREPADFLADIVGQSYFSQVVIEQLEVWQRAEEPEQFSYQLLVREYVPPPQPATAFAEGLSDLDADILDSALGFMDALALPDLLGAPSISDPTPPLGEALNGVEAALSPLEGAANNLGDAATPAAADINGLADAGNSDIAAQQAAQLGTLTGSTDALQSVQPGVEQGVQGVAAFLNNQTPPAPADPSPVQQGIAVASNLLPTDLSTLTAPLNGFIDTFFQQLNTDLTQPLAGVTEQFGRLGGLTKIGGLFAQSGGNDTSTSSMPETAVASRSARGAELPTALEKTLVDFSGRLNVFPTPLNTETLLDWLYQALQQVPRERIPLRQLPIFDELRDKLETLHQWQAMDTLTFQEWFAARLNDLSDAIPSLFAEANIRPLVEQATALQAAIPTDALNASLDALIQGLPELAQKTDNGDLDGARQDIVALSEHVNHLRVHLANVQRDAVGDRAHQWLRDLDHLHLHLEGRMLHLLAALHPVSDLDLLQLAFKPLNEILDGEGTAAAGQAFDRFFQEIRNLLAQLDLSVISNILDTAIGGATEGINTLKNTLLDATLVLAALLDQVEQAVRAVPTEALVNGLRDGLTDFRDFIQSGVATAFDAARRLLTEAFNAVEGLLQGFNPAALLAELERILRALRNILESNELQNGVRQFKGALDEANAAIGNFSFKSVADVVVEGIHAVEQAIDILKNIPLTEGIKSEIRPAVKALPSSLVGPKNELQGKLDSLVDDTVVPALNQVKTKLKEVLDAARGFSPETYFTTYLVEPYEHFLAELNNYKPSTLLASLQTELDALKERLRQAVNLQEIIDTLDAPFADLFERFDALNPEAFIEDLERQFQAGIQSVTDALPLDEIGEAFDTIADVVAEIRRAVRQLTAIRTFLNDLHERFGGLADARAQFVAIGDRYANRLNDLTLLPGADTAIENIATALQAIRANALLEAVNPSAVALAAQVRQPNVRAKLVQLVAIRRDFPRQRLNTLPDTPEKEALTALLEDFNPIHRDFSAPAGALEDFATELETVLQDLPRDFETWDARWFALGSPLTQLTNLDGSAAFWQNTLRETIRVEFSEPLAPALGWVEHLAKFSDGAATQLAGLLNDVETKINDLLDAADRIGELKTAFDGLIDTLENFDFSVVGEEIGDIFNTVRTKLNNLRPAVLLAPVKEVFDDLLDFLDLQRLLGADELDEHYDRIHAILESANPAAILPEFTDLLNTIRARIDDLDITAQIATFGQSLVHLKNDLGEQLDRTVEAYSAMYGAIPSDLKT